MLQRTRLATLVALLIALPPGCTERQENLTPDQGQAISPLAEARYLRRLHLDLSGLPPSEAEITAEKARLEGQGNTAETRRALADALLHTADFSTFYVTELEGRAFSGTSLEDGRLLSCAILVDADPACLACSASDPCACPCAPVEAVNAQVAALLAAPSKLTDGTLTPGEVERLYAGSTMFRFTGGTPEGIAASLWEAFLGRAIDPDELDNAKRMVNGTLVPGSPVGLLYHRLGESYDDLVDIVFTSEVYREAAVDQVFSRYLGRSATPVERAHFTAGLDPKRPDIRSVIREVVSSREYFGQ